MNRDEHMDWAKERAIQYAKRGDFTGAFSSLTSDLQKHPETKNHSAIELFRMMFLAGNLNSVESMVNFINDFA